MTIALCKMGDVVAYARLDVVERLPLRHNVR